jgi:hypothetical protein
LKLKKGKALNDTHFQLPFDMVQKTMDHRISFLLEKLEQLQGRASSNSVKQNDIQSKKAMEDVSLLKMELEELKRKCGTF